MVLEKIISVSMVEENVWYAVFLGVIFSTIGLVVGWVVFPSEASIVAVMFTAIASLPFIRKVIDIEERVEERAHSLKQLVTRNRKIIEIFALFFLGVVISYLFWNLILPEFSKNILFVKQASVFKLVGGSAVGSFVSMREGFIRIFSNNMKILLFCMILSLIYGSGGIVILVWNASTLGVFISSMNKLSAVIRIMPYTSLEFIGFFLAAIAGGILSVGIENHRLNSKVFRKVLQDSILLFNMAIILITAAAFIEVFILF